MVKKDFYEEELKDDGDYGEIHEIKSNIRILSPDNNLDNEDPDECEEQGCSNPAIMSWHGRRVCNGHYNAYKVKEEALFGKGLIKINPDENQ
jgi:hypothetical protein